MYIVAGSAMVALGLVAASFLAWLFRSQRTPRWLGSDLVAMLLCIPVTALIGMGGGYVFFGLSHGVGLIEMVALLGCGAVLFAVRWVIRRHMPGAAAVAGAGAAGLEPPLSGAP
jgi:heme A synthase